MLSRSWMRLLLALALLFAQHAALVHALGHDFERLRDSAPAHQSQTHQCCLLFHAADDALASTPAVGVAPDSAPATPQFHHLGRAVAASPAYQSRAPPAFS